MIYRHLLVNLSTVGYKAIACFSSTFKATWRAALKEQISQNDGFYFAFSIALYGVRFKSISTEEVELGEVLTSFMNCLAWCMISSY